MKTKSMWAGVVGLFAVAAGVGVVNWKSEAPPEAAQPGLLKSVQLKQDKRNLEKEFAENLDAKGRLSGVANRLNTEVVMMKSSQSKQQTSPQMEQKLKTYQETLAIIKSQLDAIEVRNQEIKALNSKLTAEGVQPNVRTFTQ